MEQNKERQEGEEGLKVGEGKEEGIQVEKVKKEEGPKFEEGPRGDEVKREEGLKSEEGSKVEKVKKEETIQPAVIKEIHHHHHYKRGFSLWRFAFGGFVILLGLSLLANSFGWSWSIGFDVWRLWPAFIILIGLSMLVRGSVASTIIGIVVTVLVLAFAAVVMFGNVSTDRTTSTETITVAKDAAATTATVKINSGAAKVTIGGGATDLMNGTFETNFATLTKSNTVSGTAQTVDLKTEGRNFPVLFGGAKNELSLNLSSTVPTELLVNGGAMTANLDLSNVMVTDLTVDSGATTLDLKMGDLVDTANVKIDAGASKLTLSLPKTVGARLNLKAGASSKSLTDFVDKGSDVYESANYGSATKKIELDIDIGASSLTVNWR